MRTHNLRFRASQRLLCLMLLVLIGMPIAFAFAQSDAIPIAIGDNAFATLSAESPSARYVVTATGGETATLQLLAISGDLRPTFRVVSPAGVEIASDANINSLKTVTTNINFLDAGDYQIEAAGANGTTGQFVLSLLPDAPPSLPATLAVDQRVTDAVSSQTPLRAYRFATTSSSALVLTVLPDGDANIGIVLFDEDADKTVAVQDASLRGAAIYLPAQERHYRLEIHVRDSDTSAYSVCLGVCAGQPTTAQPAEAPEASAAACTISSGTGGSVNVRSGPGTQYAIVGNLPAGQSYPVLGQISGGSWHQISINGAVGWVASSVTVLDGDCAALPVVSAPANAPLAPTQPPAPTQPAAPTQLPPGGGGPAPTSMPTTAPTAEPPAVPLPDLSVRIVIAANEPPNSVALYYTIYYTDTANTGLSAPFNTTVCLDDDCIQAGSAILSPNSSLSNTAVFSMDNVDPTRRIHVFRVTVDAFNEVNESDESNNVAVYNVSL